MSYTFREIPTFADMPDPVLTVDNVTPYEELITEEVDIHEFMQTFSPLAPFVPTATTTDFNNLYLRDFAKNVAVECLRETDAGALYSVHKVEQGGLLYVFYDKREELGDSPIRHRLYVPKALSYADFDGLVEGVSTFDDLLAIDPSSQIYLNELKAYAAWMREKHGDEDEGSEVSTHHYLKDGILVLRFEKEGDTDRYIKRVEGKSSRDFDLHYLSSPGRHIPYDAHILDMDWVE